MILRLLTLCALWLTPLAAAPSYASCWDHLVRWEGYRTRPYRDGNGWSVGVGHSLTAHRERGIWHRPYTHREIVAQFDRNLAWATDACRRGIARYDELPEDVQLVALGVTWTVGRTGLHRMTGFRAALGRRDYAGAAWTLGRYKWARQVSPERARYYAHILRAAAQ